MSRGRPSRCRTRPTCPTSLTGPTGPTCRAGRRGYTLIELVSVGALAVVLISLALAGYHTWTRDNAVAAGQRRVHAALTRARSYALAHGVETRWLAVLCDTRVDRADAVAVDYRPTATSDWQMVSQTNMLPDWVLFRTDEGQATNILFRADGSCQRYDPSDQTDQSDRIGWLRIELYHRNQTNDLRYYRALEVNRRTGLTREATP